MMIRVDQVFARETPIPNPQPLTPTHAAVDLRQRQQPLGFRFESASGRVCLTTDLGWVPDSALQLFRDVDLLVLESNYDPGMLANGPYPAFLKQRVASSHGHLSNGAAAAAIAAC